MSKLPYEISKKALADIYQIWTYTFENWSTRQADRYYQLIFDEIDQICSNSNAGKPIDHVRKGYRASKVKSHIIFYPVVNGVVQIVRVLHERMDIDERLAD